jgi:hypothetical protein
MQGFLAGSEHSLSNIPNMSIQTDQISTAKTFNLPSLWKLEVIIGFIVDSSVLQFIMYTFCKLLYAVYSRSRKGALEIGSSVSGDLTC